MDVAAVAEAARRAVDSVRAGGGPHFLELRTYRFRAHSMYDPERYREKAEVELWKERDPIPAFAARCAASGVLGTDEAAALDADAERTVDDAVAFAEAGTWEPAETLTLYVTSERVARSSGDNG
jgi:pyruvate dehydrogenase E1 component alpha subunit